MPTLTATTPSSSRRCEPGCTHNGDYGVIRGLALSYDADFSRADLLAAEFLTSYTGQTADAYRRDLADFFRHAAQAHLDPLEARRVDLAHYLNELTQAGLSAATIARRLVTLRGYYAYCVDEHAVPASPAARIKTRRPRSQTAIRALTTDELRALLWAADAHSPRIAALTWLLATTGLRISEACNARIEDLHRVGDQTWLDVTCKGNVRRSVPLVAPTHARVKAMLAMGVTLSAIGHTSAPLFATRTGNALDRHAAARTLRALATNLNLIPFSPHVLRHTFVTLARANGCALEDVQDAVGHADPATTRRYDRTIASMATHPAGPLLIALSASSSPARSARGLSRPTPGVPKLIPRPIQGRGRAHLRLICT